MGKRAEKKTRVPAKEKRVVAHSPKNVLQQSNPVESSDGVSIVKETKVCPHLDKGIDMEKLSTKIGSSDPIRCEDCREDTSDRKGRKGKGKHGKKKGGAASDSKAIWVCLDCGHYACGGVGLPTTPQSHVLRHAKLTRHPLVIQWGNRHLRWCFPCNTLIPVEKAEENCENKDIFLDVVKLIKGRPTEGSSVDVLDVWFGSGSVTTEIKSEGTLPSGGGLDENAGYVVRGLTNLGNTCFFNSVMQNLLAIGRLRDYFLNLDENFGPLTIALKKLFVETKPQAGLRNVINPRSLFGCLCSKAPQFRGFQQHDSHELLHSLLDGLCTEELGARKKINASEQTGISSKQGPTFVDSAFGGQISSTVCCVECGHSSTVYEPFLDLSLPVPTKKPTSKKGQPVSRAKKTKLPPKKSGKTRQKANKDTNIVSAQCISNSPINSESPSLSQSSVPLTEKVVSSSGESSLSGDVPISMATQNGLASQNVSAVSQHENEQVLENSMDQTVASLDDLSWLDYVEVDTKPDEHDSTFQNNDILSIQGSGDQEKVFDDILMKSSQILSPDGEPNIKPDSCSVNPSEDELPLLAQDSEVILPPSHNESSATVGILSRDAEASPVVSCGQEESDFNGFGGLFDEPEIAAGPVAGPSLPKGSSVAGNSSESDPDEVDNSDSPVSVESCLAHFMKPELLTKDNAWDCESCTRTLEKQKLKVLNKRAKLALKTLGSGGETRNENDLKMTNDNSSLFEDKNLSNGDINTDIDPNTFSESLVSHSGKTDCIDQNCAEVESDQTCKMNLVVSLREEGKVVMNDAVEEQSHSLGFYKSCSQESITDHAEDRCSADESCSTGRTTDKAQRSDSQLFPGIRESEESKGEEITSKEVKAKRDATKKVLINKAPPILTIHLKRFSQDARGRLSKLNGHVNFRETVDLSPYVDPRCVDQEKYVYRLVGVVEHSGTMKGGHYVAYVRGAAKRRGKAEEENESCVWYHASDAYVREVSLEQVLSCEAYILFYDRI